MAFTQPRQSRQSRQVVLEQFEGYPQGQTITWTSGVTSTLDGPQNTDSNLYPATFAQNFNINSNTTVNSGDTTTLIVGMGVKGSNIAAGSVIASITNITTFELSIAATASTTQSLTFTKPYIFWQQLDPNLKYQYAMGSIINYKPPPGTTTVVYEYGVHAYTGDAGGILNLKFLLGGNNPNYHDLLATNTGTYSLIGDNQSDSTSGTDLALSRYATRLGMTVDHQVRTYFRAIIHITGKKTTLNGALSADANGNNGSSIIITVTDSSTFASAGFINIGEETIEYTANSSNQLTLKTGGSGTGRGANASTVTDHSNGAVVSFDDIHNGQIGSWDTQRKMKVTARDYNASYDIILNKRDDYYIDGPGAQDELPILPILKITALKGPSISYP